MDDTVLLRISGNDSSGRFSKEWVPAEAVRRSISQLPKGATSFKGAAALRTAWKGQSSCNSGFGAAIMRAEGVFTVDEDPKKKGMLKLAAPDALDQWEQGVLALPVPKDAERVLLKPPKPQAFFGNRSDGRGDLCSDPARGGGPKLQTERSLPHIGFQEYGNQRLIVRGVPWKNSSRQLVHVVR